MSGALAQGSRIGPYQIGPLIGSGGMGRVYRAHDPRLSRHVAIKILEECLAADASAVGRFETEARAAGSLDHPNLLVVFDAGREGDLCFIVSELLEGETLHERLQRGALPERVALEIAVQICRGLAAAHARGVVHRDLKPANVFITRDRRVKILDFGVAKLTAPSQGDLQTTMTARQSAAGIVVGTLGYMAPEQIRGGAVDHRADLFAVGLLLHEMLTGSRPFQRGSLHETVSAILDAEPPALPASVNPALQNIISRCLEKAPEDRFQSAHDLALVLDLLTGQPGSAPRPSALPRRRLILQGAGVAGLTLAALTGARYFGIGRGDSPDLPAFQRLTFRRGLVRSARVAPDGETILYGALWDADLCRIYSTRTDHPESRALDLPPANLLAVSSTGELALCLGANLEGVFTYGTLARVPIAGGAPRELVENVKFADWSPDGAQLALIRRVDGVDQLEYPSGHVLLRPGAGQGSGLGFVRISPDGRHVAFVHYRDPQSLVGRVCIADEAGAVRVLTEESVNLHGLAWHKDEIWYSAADERPLFRALFAVSPRGGNPVIKARMPVNVTLWDATADGRLLIAQTDDRAAMIGRFPGDQNDRDLSWLDASWGEDLSRDGRLLLFSETGQGVRAVPAAYLRGNDGAPAIRIGSGRPLALSPDARQALVMNSDESTGESVFALVPTGAGESRRLAIEGFTAQSAMWLPDGQRIALVASRGGERSRVFIITLDGSANAVTPEGVGSAAVSPDGAWIAAGGQGEPFRLYPVDGGEAREIPASSDRSLWLLGWISDGLLFTRRGDPDARGEVYLVDAVTGAQRPWANILPRDAAGIMVLVTFRVTPDGQSRLYTWHRALSNLYMAQGLA